ncbi:hypothetical protein ACFYRN_45015 [Streptomyces sp. NPDC005227]|uniref:hypothetical protein n=1 Tax=Streptomyces sp. NPDC005227 TaxID=3364707 RepID=UPI0036CF88ED
MLVRRAAAALVIACTATACSVTAGSGPNADAPAAAAKSSGKPTSSPAADALAFGAGSHWSDTDTDGSHISGTTTVIGYRQPAQGVSLPDEASGLPHPDWAVLDVKVCAATDSTNVIVAQGPWSLRYADGTRLTAPKISAEGVAEPVYSVGGAVVRPGTCYRGKITFSVKHGSTPTGVVYDVDSRDPVEWTVPKA